LDLAYREYSNIEMILGDNLGNHVGRNRETVEDESLDVLKDVPAPQGVEYIQKRPAIEAAIGLTHAV
jgi:hypothetical protein